MKNKIIFVLAIFVTYFWASCQQTNQQEAVDADTVVGETIDVPEEEIFEATLTGDDGKILYAEFNNTNETAVLVFEGDTILLTQDVMASGIQYSNELFNYTEHQGHATLTKDGEVIFEKSN